MSDGRIRVAFDAHVLGRRGTGNERYAIGLATALSEREDVEVLAYVDQGRVWPVPAPRLATRALRMRWPQVRIPYELPMRIRRDRADLLHVQYAPPPVAGVPVITAIHDVSFVDEPSGFSPVSRLRMKASVRLAVRRSAALMVLSRFTRDRLVDHYSVDPARIHIAPPGVGSEWATEASGTTGCLATMSLPPDFVLAVGDLHPRKNLPRLIHAVASARAQGAGDLGLVITGPMRRRATDVDSAIDSTGGHGWVRRLGFVDDGTLHQLYRRARVVAYLSLYEGFGLPVIESLAAGAVLVASATTAVPEAAGDAAILVDPTDTIAIASAIARAATETSLRERLTAAGPGHAARFTWAVCAEATLGAYRSALGGH